MSSTKSIPKNGGLVIVNKYAYLSFFIGLKAKLTRGRVCYF